MGLALTKTSSPKLGTAEGGTLDRRRRNLSEKAFTISCKMKEDWRESDERFPATGRSGERGGAAQEAMRMTGRGVRRTLGMLKQGGGASLGAIAIFGIVSESHAAADAAVSYGHHL